MLTFQTKRIAIATRKLEAQAKKELQEVKEYRLRQQIFNKRFATAIENLEKQIDKLEQKNAILY